MVVEIQSLLIMDEIRKMMGMIIAITRGAIEPQVKGLEMKVEGRNSI